MIYNDNMRTIITLTDKHVKLLRELCDAEKISRAELIRKAIDAYAEKKRSTKKSANVFGIWKKHKVDALQYENNIRNEW
jgi:metal-responsive CopG/Arc/MetJ family transcriptional regulator